MSRADAARGDNKIVLAAHASHGLNAGRSITEVELNTYISSSSSGITSIRFLLISADHTKNPQINTKVKTELRKEAEG